MQSLIAVEAYQGVRNFDGRAYGDLRSISMLWPNVEHFVMLESRVKDGTLNDIVGTRFSVGPQASGTEQSTMIILQGVNLTKSRCRRNTSATAIRFPQCATAPGRRRPARRGAGRRRHRHVCQRRAGTHPGSHRRTAGQHQRHRQFLVPLRHQGGDLPAPAQGGRHHRAAQYSGGPQPAR
ncbi:TAXI family TRAP transporter solute-binding subunit [Serratia ureilytica]